MTREDETPHENRNKRVRVNEEANTFIEANEPATPKENLPPSAASRAALKEAVASHPDAIKEVAEALLKDYVSLKNQERQEANTMSHFNDTAWMPRSARMKFSLTSSESLMETEDFKKLSAEATAATAAFQHKAKSLIKSVLKMATMETKSRFKELMERALFRFGAMILLEDKAYTDDPPTEKFVWYCLSKDDIPARVFDYTETRKATLGTTFHQKANDRLAQEIADDKAKATNDQMDTDDDEIDTLAVTDPATQPPTVTAPTPTADISAEEVSYFKTLLPKFATLLTALFATCWEHQLAAQAKLDSNRRLKKQAQEFLKGDKSKDTAIDLEKEPKIEPKRIAELVKKEVAKATGKLNKKVDRVNQQTNRSAKNDQRGAPQRQRQQQQPPSSPASASSKKKQAEKKKGQNPNNNGPRGRAPARDAAATRDNTNPPQRGRGNSRDSKGNDSRKGKPGKKTTGGSNKQKGRPRSTSTGRQRASNR